VLHHHSVGADAGVLAHRNRPQHLRPRTDDDAIPKCRVALAVDLGGGVDRGGNAAEGDAVVKRHVVPDLGRLADDEAHAVIDEEPLADGGAGMDLDPRDETPDAGDDAAEQKPAAAPGGVRQAIEHHRLKAGIGEHDFQTRARGRVPRDHGIDLVTKILENHVTRHDKIAAIVGAVLRPVSGDQWFDIVCPTKLVKFPRPGPAWARPAVYYGLGRPKLSAQA